MKVKMNVFLFIIVSHVYVAMAAATPAVSVSVSAATTTILPITYENNFKEFIEQVEELVLHTTEEALKVTIRVYRNLTKSMPPLLQHAIVPITTDYIRSAEAAFKRPRNYSEQRKLLRQFRHNNIQIERLRQQLQPQHPKFQFHLISHEFYYTGKNLTEFDNLYLKFMLDFEHVSQTLWDTMSEEIVEQQQDLLEILDEISNEKELAEKDKLYDEFIEMFLFKTEIGAAENRQLD